MKAKQSWKRLENAAKIFPTTSSRDAKVFRFSCETDDEIYPDILQKALDQTLERFPHYLQVIRKGLFWHYFEDSTLKPIVREEYKPPCSTIYNSNKCGLLFEVTFYKKRINLEVFHALSDGIGALHFLRTLVLNYITRCYENEYATPLTLDYDASVMQRESDSFAKYYQKVKSRRIKSPNAFHLRGERLPENRMGIIEGIISVKAMITLSRGMGCTITEMLTALLIFSIHEVMPLRDEDKPIVITVPVNLRNYFPSESSRNFFCTINISHHFKTDGKTFEDVLNHVKSQFKEELTPEKIANRMNLFTSMEHKLGLQLVPLAIKIPVLRIANYMEEQTITAALSNIGVVKMPPEMQKHLKAFEVYAATKRLQICVCSYRDAMTLSFTSSMIETDVQRCFFRMLVQFGIDVAVFSNLEGGNHAM